MDEFLRGFLIGGGSLGALGLLLGALVNHRFNISRDRRREFIELARETADQLEIEARGGGGKLSDRNFQRIRSYLSPWRRRGFDKALAEYQGSKEHSRRDILGGAHLLDPARHKRATRALADLIERNT